MKNKYERLSAEEKKKAKVDYRESNEVNWRIYKSLKRVYILGIIGVIYAILSFALDFHFKTLSVWDYVLDGLLLIFCTYFIIQSRKMLIEQVNKFLIGEVKKSKKK